MGETEKSSSQPTVEKVSAEEQARHSTSGFVVASALCCIATVVICVLLFTAASSSSSPAAVSAKKEDASSATVVPAGVNTTVSTARRPSTSHPSANTSPDLSGAKPSSAATGEKPGSEKHTVQGREDRPSMGKPTKATPPPRPTPPYTLTCTLGPFMEASTVLPEDGLCGYIMLDWLPATKAADLAGPFPANVTRFLSVAASYRGTEFGIAFDSRTKEQMKEILHDSTAKAHFDALYDKRIWHFGYINTDNFALDIKVLHVMVQIVKSIKDLLKDKSTPDHQARTFLAFGWRARLNRISVRDLAASFSLSEKPDLLISKAHYSDFDMTFEQCRILPSTFLQRVGQETEQGSIYEFSLLTAFKYASDVVKRVHGSTLSVSVGLQGRWYLTLANQTEDPKVGDHCQPASVKSGDRLFASAATACKNPDVRKSEEFHCKYIVDKEAEKIFTFDDADTLRYKLCTGKKNLTSLEVGIVAAGIEYADAGGRCGKGGTTFPLLRTLGSLVKFFKDHYKSERDFEKCLSQGTAFKSRGRAKHFSR